MRVLVIGGTNFIGPHVVAALHQQGHDVTVYHRGVHEPDLPASVRHIHSPRAAIPILHFPSSLTDPPPDVVLHMVPVGEDDARAAVARFTGVVRRIVVLSSGDVYRAYGRLLGSEPGPPETVPLDEDAPLRATLFPYRHTAAGPSEWTYHYEKILVERAVLAGRVVATVLRLPAVYGPGDPYRRFRPYIKRMLDDRPSILMEAQQAGWCWTHGYVEDVARAVALATVEERAAGKTFNLGEAETPTTVDRIRRMGHQLEWRGSIVLLSDQELPSHLRPPYQPTQDLVLETGRFRSELGFRETISSGEALRKTIEWERDNPPASGDPGPSDYALEDAALGKRTSSPP